MTGAGTVLVHNKISLHLHRLGGGEGPNLLLLHGLGEQTSPPQSPWDGWPGPIWGLDFTGHGSSTVPRGGGYTCESLMADVDVALAHVGSATILGRGLGAYVAVMIAGARPSLVRGAVLGDGPGLDGGGPGPSSSIWFLPAGAGVRAPDPFALTELSNEPRPPDYAVDYAHLLLDHSALDVPLVVTAKNRPPWLAAVADQPGVVVESSAEAFERFRPS